MKNIIEIKSASNDKFKFFKSLLTKKGRDESGQYMVEGIKSVKEALNSQRNIEAVIIKEGLACDIGQVTCPMYVMPQMLTDRLSDTKSPQGIYAVINKLNKDIQLKKDGAYVYCDRVSDPGNLGTIIRTADSAGFEGVLLSPDCVEVHNPKTVRSCMGSFFRMEVIENVDPGFLRAYSETDGKIYGGILSGDTKDYRSVDYKGSVMIVVGNEATGISEPVQKICTPVKIPIYGGAESLNVAVAASILMYEAANSRHK